MKAHCIRTSCTLIIFFKLFWQYMYLAFFLVWAFMNYLNIWHASSDLWRAAATQVSRECFRDPSIIRGTIFIDWKITELFKPHCACCLCLGQWSLNLVKCQWNLVWMQYLSRHCAWWLWCGLLAIMWRIWSWYGGEDSWTHQIFPVHENSDYAVIE